MIIRAQYSRAAGGPSRAATAAAFELAAPVAALVLTLAAVLAPGAARAGEPGAGGTVLRAADARIREVGGKSGPGGWNLWSNGALGDWFDVPAPGRVAVTVTASGQPAADVFPRVRLRAEYAVGKEAFSRDFTAATREYEDYRFEFDAAKGTLRITVAFLNDLFKDGEDRNLLVREIRVKGAALAAEPPEVKDLTDAAIVEHRTGTLTVLTRPGAKIKVTQLRHEFHFGTAIAWSMFRDGGDAETKRRYREVLAANFNSAVHENALKWYHTEGSARGRYNWADVDRMLDWCEANGIATRGHCIFWPVDKYVQKWIKALDEAELRRVVERRAREVTARYRGRIREYDLSNEMLHGRYYRKRLGEGIVADMARWARDGDPDAVLYVNDYGIITGGDAGRYAEQIRGFLEQGIPLGGIGCQGHFGGSVDVRRVRRVLDLLARFGLPIKITEFDMNTSDEGKKAEGLEALYRTCFAHPAVEGILMWGFWEGRHWRPNAALWKRDWTPTPAAKAYRRLVYDEWWTRWEGEADESGRAEVRAFFGTHRVEAAGREKRVELTKKAGRATVRVGR